MGGADRQFRRGRQAMRTHTVDRQAFSRFSCDGKKISETDRRKMHSLSLA